MLRRNAYWVAGGVITGVAWRLLMFVPPVALGRAIDEGVLGDDRSAGLTWIGIALVTGLLIAAISMLRHWYAAGGYFAGHDGMRRQLLALVQSIDLSWHAARPRGEVLSRVNADSRQAVALLDEIPSGAGSVVSLVVTSATLFLISTELALIATATMPLVVIVSLISGSRIRRGTTRVQHHTAEMTGTLEETLAGIVVVKSLGAETARMETLEQDSDAVRLSATALEKTQAALDSAAKLIPEIAIAAGLFVGGRQVVSGDLTVGELSAFIAWMLIYSSLISTIGWRVVGVFRTIAAVRRLEDDVLSYAPRTWGDRHDTGDAPVLRVENLTVRRGTRTLLDDVTFEVAWGERLAITGSTGSGKSTLLSTLPGLIAPDAGRVLLNGTPIEAFDQETLRARVLLVPEESFVFEDTVRRNLTLGKDEAFSDDELWRALRFAAVEPLIRSLDGDLDSLIGHAGRELSGGEVQRLCLARALLHRPAILILDDALSAVDQETEAQILQGLKQWDGTIIFTSNRQLMLDLATRQLHLTAGRLTTAEQKRALASLTYAYDEIEAPEGAGTRLLFSDNDIPARLRDVLASGEDVRGVLGKAWPLLRPFARRMLAAAVLSILATVAALVTPQIISRVIDGGLLAGDATSLAWLAGAYALISLLAVGLHYAFIVISAGAGEDALHSMRVRTWSSLHNQPLAFFEAIHTGELVSRATDDIQRLADFIRKSLERLIRLVALLGLGLVFMFATSWQLTLVSLAIIALNLIGLAVYARLSPPRYAAWGQADAEAVNTLNQAISGVTVTQAMARPDYMGARVTATGRRFIERSRAMVKFENWAFLPIELTSALTTALVIGAGILFIGQGWTSVGAVVAMAVYVQMMLEPLGIMTEIAGTTQKSRVALARLLSIQNLPPETAEAAMETIPSRGVLQVNGVSFGYQPGQPVVSDVTFSVPPGRQTALVGPTGAGKSTLAKLIAGLEAPHTGYISIGGARIHDSSLQHRRRAVAYVPQNGHLFSGTIADNLRLARADAADRDLLQAVETAGIRDLVNRMPTGLSSPVGRQGALLSAGERQLIALARLALRDPAVIVLDESTSRLDDHTEAEFGACLRRIGAGRSLIVIAHRPSTIAMADEVLELRDGGLHPVKVVPN